MRVFNFLQYFGFYFDNCIFFAAYIFKTCDKIQTLDFEVGDETCLEHFRHKS